MLDSLTVALVENDRSQAELYRAMAMLHNEGVQRGDVTGALPGRIINLVGNLLSSSEIPQDYIDRLVKAAVGGVEVVQGAPDLVLVDARWEGEDPFSGKPKGLEAIESLKTVGYNAVGITAHPDFAERFDFRRKPTSPDAFIALIASSLPKLQLAA